VKRIKKVGEMKTVLRAGGSLFVLAVCAGTVLPSAPAAAQDAASIQAIQRQIQQLQQQLRKLQADAAKRDAELKHAQEEAAQARAAAAQASQQAPQVPSAVSTLVVPPSVAPGSAVLTIPPNDVDKATGRKFYNPNKPNGSFNLGGVTITVGGYVDLTIFGRSRNESRGTATSFNGVPFIGPTAQGDTGEFNISAQQTRISLRATANPGAGQTLVGYVEADFANGAGGANSNQSYSYTPRLRHAFVDYAYDPWSTYVMAGQSWSLATPFKKALDPFATWQPPTIDQAYLVGYEYLRVPLVRLVKGFGPAWLGVEADAPQTIFGGTSPTVAGGAVVTGFAGNGGLNPQATYSTNVAPDLIAKGAVDTSVGHYEVFGIARWFQDQVTFATHAGNTAGFERTNQSMGGGVGFSAYIPLFKYADLAGNVLYGSGIGRYGTGGLPDVTFAADGSLKPLRELMGTVGVIGHVRPNFDLYAFYGYDTISSSFFGSTGGYGNPGASNAGCYNPNASVAPTLTCTANTSRLREITVGYNWRLLRGPYGTLQTGLQYGYVQRNVFGAKGGSPTGVENIFFANLRYLPFE
jgi:hypothetical protein